MELNIQDIVDRIFERKTVDRIIPVTQYEYKQREGRHMMDTAQLNDEVTKLRKALVANDIEVAEEATDEEIITAMLTEEQNFQHQQDVNTYNERVVRYKEGSLVERVRIMFDGAPKKPQRNPLMDDDEYEEKPSYVSPEEDTLTEEETGEITNILSNLTEKDFSKIEQEGNKEDAIKLANEVSEVLSKANTQAEPETV